MMRYAICNETFGDWDFARTCAVAAEHGYTGIEVAPFTLAPLITDISANRRAHLRRQAEAAGISIVALHWLLGKTEGFHVTSPEPEVRVRTASYLAELARCCREFGGEIMVFGSPQQRRIPHGRTLSDATDFAADTFTRLQPALDDSGVTLALEPLAATETDFLTSCADACALLDRLSHPRFALHLDVKAMCSEESSIPDLIHQHISRTVHFHSNDVNRRGPGFGEVDFRPILRALRESDYGGWVSVEVFDYSPDPVTIARESIRYLRQCEDG
jgi:sugar phosphate isomerase/epimerase